MADYGFEHDGRVYTPNSTPDVKPEDNQARNQAIQQAELAYWQTRPDYMIGYYNLPAENINIPGQRREYRADFYPMLTGATITLWLGAVIGQIVSAHVYRHNFGHRFVSLRVRGTNGAMYYGRASYDWGQCINLRKCK